jgi:hypothetical protein
MKSNKKLLIVMLLVTPVFMYILYGTDLITPKVEYVRLKNGQEFRNVPMRWPSDIDVIIDGKHYTNFDIDSLVR